MSRVFEALQKSQGENPSASPLAHPESAPVEAPASAAAAVIPATVAEEVLSAILEIPAMAASGIPAAAPADCKWLNVPAAGSCIPIPHLNNGWFPLLNPIVRALRCPCAEHAAGPYATQAAFA
jgi:hypothetical protein